MGVSWKFNIEVSKMIKNHMKSSLMVVTFKVLNIWQKTVWRHNGCKDIDNTICEGYFNVAVVI